MFLDPPCDKTAFAVGIRGLKIIDPLAAWIRRPEFFLLLVYVVRYYRVGRVEYCLRRTVILFEQDHFRIWKRVLEFQNVSNVGLPKSVKCFGHHHRPRRCFAASQSDI
jgi:hypothetical protein